MTDEDKIQMRAIALDVAKTLGQPGEPRPVDALLADAKKIEAFLLGESEEK